MTDLITVIDFICLLTLSVSFVILWRGWNNAFKRDTRLLFAGILVVSLFNVFSDILKISGITVALRTYNDYIQLFNPIFWGLFIYSFLNESIDLDLRESEEKYRNLVDRANDGITIIQDGVIKYANLRLTEMYGDASENIINTPFTNYILSEELSKVADRYKRRMAGEKVEAMYETILRRKDGGTLYVELNAGTILYQGKPADLVIIRDTTERKKAEKELKERLDELERFHKATVSRELTMIELKKKIKELEEEIEGLKGKSG